MSSILVLNAGSSSLKFAVFDASSSEPALKLGGQVSGLGSTPRFKAHDAGGTELVRKDIKPASGFGHPEAHKHVMQWLTGQGVEPTALAGVGHRIVHGGTRYTAPTLVDDAIQTGLEELRALAPLHLPFGLGALRRMRELAPGVPQVACFDTAFHASQPELATRLPLPMEYEDKGYRRYGFHGLNYEHVADVLPKLAHRPLPRRLLVAHLGNGASMCAVKDGKSIATSMGYSTADGLVMGTRTGAIDPGVLIALMRDEGAGIEDLEDLLYRKSGLLGLSGFSSDMRELLASDDPRAGDAIDYYCYWAARYAGSLVTVLGGLDGLVFTGGIGENAAPVRAKILDQVRWLGLVYDEDRNAQNLPEISPSGAVCPVWIVKANEELTIARHVQNMLS